MGHRTTMAMLNNQRVPQFTIHSPASNHGSNFNMGYISIPLTTSERAPRLHVLDGYFGSNTKVTSHPFLFLYIARDLTNCDLSNEIDFPSTLIIIDFARSFGLLVKFTTVSHLNHPNFNMQQNINKPSSQVRNSLQFDQFQMDNAHQQLSCIKGLQEGAIFMYRYVHMSYGFTFISVYAFVY